jgi:hypothetical protein
MSFTLFLLINAIKKTKRNPSNGIIRGEIVFYATSVARIIVVNLEDDVV